MAKTITRTWPSFQAFIDTAENGETDCRARTSRQEGRSDWTGTDGYPQAVSLARLGWPEGTNKAKILTNAAVVQVSEILHREEWQFSVEAGRGEVDPERYLEGDPECILASDTVEESAIRKALHIVASVTASSGVDAEAMIARGAAVTALTELLTMSGYHVKVTLVDCRSRDSQTIEYRVTLKDYMESFDVSRFIYAAAHPSTLRRHCFSVNEQESPEVRDAFGFNGGGYGIPADGQERGDIYLGKMGRRDGDWNNPAYTLHWILDQLRKQGVKVEA